MCLGRCSIPDCILELVSLPRDMDFLRFYPTTFLMWEPTSCVQVFAQLPAHLHVRRLVRQGSPFSRNLTTPTWIIPRTKSASLLTVSQVSNPAIPLNSTINNLPAAANDNTQLHWQDFNFTAIFQAEDYDKDLFHVIMVGDATFGPDDAQALAQENFDALVRAGVFSADGSNQAEQLTWVAFSDHGPMHDRVTVAELQAGFYQGLYGLQGRRSTWFTGGAWASNYQTILWEYNEVLLPKILAV